MGVGGGRSRRSAAGDDPKYLRVARLHRLILGHGPPIDQDRHFVRRETDLVEEFRVSRRLHLELVRFVPHDLKGHVHEWPSTARAFSVVVGGPRAG